jgi:alpha-D-xyloside xylohydrolase
MEGDSLHVTTPDLLLAVSLVTGQLSFAGAGNRPLVKETSAGNSFMPAVADGQPCYAISSTFEAQPDDAWYGLGQHQDDQYNYRNKQVRFFQNNTSVAVPFVLSRKQYGILWDNNSLSTAGDIRDWHPLSHLRLFNAAGKEGWLTQTFANNKTQPQQLLLTRAASAIDIAYLGDSKIAFPEGFTPAKGIVRYKGAFASAFTGVHKFDFTYAGYVKVRINGKLVLDRWRQAWNPGAGVVEIALVREQQYNLEIEWLPDGTESYLTCKWLPPVPASAQNNFAFASQAAHTIDYYFITGDHMDSVIAGYRHLTGKAVLLPKWAFGFWQSRERYKTQAELLDVVKEFRQRKIPIDNIVQDWSYWKEKEWGSQEFDNTRFPAPDSMIAALHNKYHTQLMISVWPKFYTGIPAYDHFNQNGWLYGRNVADSQRDWIKSGYVSTFYDAFNAGARQGFWNLLRDKLYSKGVDAWWMDASEPDILSNVNPEKRISQMTPTALGPAALWLNAYPLQNARGIYEGQRATGDNKRVFLLTRSGFAGSQRYAAAIWSGDIASRWEDMKAQITAGLNFCMSGLPYWTMDIGGFSVEQRYEKPNKTDEEEWRELQTRWYQFGAFTPLFRVHGQYPYREIYNIAPETHPAYQSMLYYNQLRYRLLPYIYSLAGSAYRNDYTLMRGLVMDFAKDTAVTNISDQFMLGPSILVNPVYSYKARSRQVYLPAGTGWYDFYKGTYLEGGNTITAEAPYEKMPLFVKEGSIIPAGPSLQYVAEKKADPITLFVYTGKDAGFELYEDGGLDYAYEKGSYAVIPFSYNEATGTLTIGARKGDFPGMQQQRSFKIVRIGKSNPMGFDPDTQTNTIIKYEGKKITIPLK